MNKIKFIRVLILGLMISLNQILAEDDVQEVVVISSKYPVPLEEVVGRVDSISLEDLETRMVSALGDMLDKTIRKFLFILPISTKA